jgi:hypothetical protein
VQDAEGLLVTHRPPVAAQLPAAEADDADLPPERTTGFAAVGRTG